MGAFIDKHGKLRSLAEQAPVVIELGCGSHKRRREAIAIDAIDAHCVDVVGDVFDVLPTIAAESVDEVFSSHFVEHLADPERLLRELRRVLKVGGRVITVAPHFSNPYFYSDYTHRTAFGLYSFSYLAHDRIFRRQVPHYSEDPGFQLTSVRLRFKASRPFYFRYVFRKILEQFVNLSVFTQELYEDGWCYLFPCYEVEYVIIKRS